jgi:hypothetical protein
MSLPVTNRNAVAFAGEVSNSGEENFRDALHALHTSVDRFFAKLMLVQWAACVLLAWLVSPLTWKGTIPSVHPHLWASLLLGGAIALYPAYCGFRRPGKVLTRYALAVAQMLMSALLIHLTGGRIETHFHVFGSLAFLAFYRIPASFMQPRSWWRSTICSGECSGPSQVYGVFIASPWRTVEHAFWVVFEVAFLSASIRRSLRRCTRWPAVRPRLKT